MAGTVKHAKLESRTSRSRLKRGRQPHWQALIPSRVHLGYQCWKGEEGRWSLRRRYNSNNKYRSVTLGRADDAAAADGEHVLTFEQAEAKARATVAAPNGGKVMNLTVRQAMARYLDYKRSQGQPVNDLLGRSNAHILPVLGDLVVAELTAEQLRRWLATMAAAPAQSRPRQASRNSSRRRPPPKRYAPAARVPIVC